MNYMKIEKGLDVIKIKDEFDLPELLIKYAQALNKKDCIGIIGTGKQIADLLKSLMCNLEDTHLAYANIDASNENEHYLGLYKNGKIIKAAILRNWDTDEYDLYDADVVFIFGNCNSRVLSKNIAKDPAIYMLEDSTQTDTNIDDKSEKCTKKCEKCKSDSDCDTDKPDVSIQTIESDHLPIGKLYGFNASKANNNCAKSCSFYTTYPVDEDFIQNILTRFGF